MSEARGALCNACGGPMLSARGVGDHPILRCNCGREIPDERAVRRGPATTPYLRELERARRAKKAAERALTDAERAALRAACRDKGAPVRPSTALKGDRDGIWHGHALALVQRGLATMTCTIDQEHLRIDRHDQYRDGGLLFATPEGRSALKHVLPATVETLAPVGQQRGADENAHFHDGRDPLDAGGYQNPDDAGIDPGRRRRSEEQRLEAQDRRARARATRDRAA